MSLDTYIIPGKSTIIEIADDGALNTLYYQAQQSKLYKGHKSIYHIIKPENKAIGYKKEEFEPIKHLLLLHQTDVYQIIIIKSADTISHLIGNSLLLALENLSAHIAIVLVTHNIKLLLPTIVSRSIIFHINHNTPHNTTLAHLIELITNQTTTIDVFDTFLQTQDIPLDTLPFFWELLLCHMAKHYKSEYIEKIQRIKTNAQLVASQTLYKNLIRLIFMILQD